MALLYAVLKLFQNSSDPKEKHEKKIKKKNRKKKIKKIWF